MYFTSIALMLAGFNPALVSAGLDIDSEDISSACSAICQPLVDLTQTCNVRDEQVDDDRTEKLLEAQCICTNDSFDVAGIAGLCASCMDQNRSGDDWEDGYEDIRSVMRTCGFSSTSYASSASTAAQSITVVATRPTAASQLTTTISTGVGAATQGSTATQTSSSTSSEQTSQDQTSSPSTTPNAATTTVPMGAGSVTLGAYIAGLMVLGSMLLA